MSSTLRATVVASIGLAFVPSTLHAEELAQTQAPAMPAITVTAPTASLTVPSAKQAEEEINKTPGGVEVVPASRYLDGRATTMKDMLDYTPGVWVQSKYGQEDSKLVIRGSGLSRNFHLRGVRLLQDGSPINLADGSGDFHEIDPLAQQYVEVYKGANALRYGAATLGGAINFVSPTGRSNPGYAARFYGGSYQTFGEQAIAGGGDAERVVAVAVGGAGTGDDQGRGPGRPYRRQQGPVQGRRFRWQCDRGGDRICQQGRGEDEAEHGRSPYVGLALRKAGGVTDYGRAANRSTF